MKSPSIALQPRSRLAAALGATLLLGLLAALVLPAAALASDSQWQGNGYPSATCQADTTGTMLWVWTGDDPTSLTINGTTYTGWEQQGGGAWHLTLDIVPGTNYPPEEGSGTFVTYTGDAGTLTLSHCDEGTQSTPEPTPVVTPEPTPVVTPEPTPVVTPEPTPVVTPEPTPGEETAAPTPVVTPEPTPGEETAAPTPGEETAAPTPSPTGEVLAETAPPTDVGGPGSGSGSGGSMLFTLLALAGLGLAVVVVTPTPEAIKKRMR
jgi:hypothetical protein